MCATCKNTPQVGVMDLYAPCKNNYMKGRIVTKEGNLNVPVEGVTIFNTINKKWTTSDKGGNYTLDAEAGDVIEISHVTYKSVKNIAKNIPQLLFLEENINELPPVTLTPQMQAERDKKQNQNHNTRQVEVKPSNNEKLSNAKTWIWLAILGGISVFAFYKYNKKSKKL